jgi:hypothetical protein
MLVSVLDPAAGPDATDSHPTVSQPIQYRYRYCTVPITATPLARSVERLSSSCTLIVASIVIIIKVVVVGATPEVWRWRTSVPLFVSLHHGIYEDEDEDTVIRGLDSSCCPSSFIIVRVRV